MRRLIMFLRGVLGVAMLDVAPLLRQPGWMIQEASMTIAFIIMLWALGGSFGLKNALIGMIVATIFGVGVNLIGQSIGYDKILRILDMYIASPISIPKYFLGVFLGELIWLPSTLIPLITITLLTGQHMILYLTLLASLPLLFISISIGIFIGFGVRNPTNISAITNPTAFILSFLPPVYYPATFLPPIVREISLITPTAATAELARWLVFKEASADPLFLLTTIIIWIIVSIILIIIYGRPKFD
jgi:ABC-2 type transport system permease protein